MDPSPNTVIRNFQSIHLHHGVSSSSSDKQVKLAKLSFFCSNVKFALHHAKVWKNSDQVSCSCLPLLYLSNVPFQSVVLGPAPIFFMLGVELSRKVLKDVSRDCPSNVCMCVCQNLHFLGNFLQYEQKFCLNHSF